jgi:hypothetical protein
MYSYILICVIRIVIMYVIAEQIWNFTLTTDLICKESETVWLYKMLLTCSRTWWSQRPGL